jgi:dsRNA-specific ribonuclease
MREKVELKFHEIMAQPFIEKVNLIQNTFSQFDNEKQFEKSARIYPSLEVKISHILNTCPEKIKNATHYKIRNSNLLLLIFLYEDISKIYSDSVVPRSENLEKMKTIKEDFLTLAFIGDRALELGILQSIWIDEKKSRDIPLKGDLDAQKKNFVENKNLAIIWDFLDLYDNLIFTKKKNESLKLRASRLEAVLGIIYIESGLEAVENAIQNLKCNYEKNQNKDS